jgi:hypothetical protein
VPTKTLQILNLFGFILVIVMNALANALPINGYNTGEISDSYPNLFVPAGFTFGIWGVIYLLLLTFTIYQARNWWKKEKVDLSIIEKIGPWFFISCLANASWILVWHHLLPGIALLVMLVLLGSLLIIYQRLHLTTILPGNRLSYWAVHLPFSVYLGWITVATIANVTALLVDLAWSGGPLSEVSWTIIMIATATVIGLLILWRRGDIPFNLVLIWAFYGIFSKQNAMDGVVGIGQVALLCIGLLTLGALFQLLIRKDSGSLTT